MRTATLVRCSLVSLSAAGCGLALVGLSHLSVSLPVHQLRIAWTLTRFLVQL